MKIQYAMVFVSDMDKATAFYRDVVGLQERVTPFGARLAQDSGPYGLEFSVGETRAG